MDEGSAQSKSRKMQERTLKDAITHAAEIKMTQSSPEEEPVVGCGPGAEDSPTLMPEQALSQKIRVAHAYVEHCLVRYMTKDETVQKVSEFSHCRISTDMVESVWTSLEEGNPSFFKRYNRTVILKQQLENFNQLVIQQHAAMKYIGKNTQLKQVEVEINRSC